MNYYRLQFDEWSTVIQARDLDGAWDVAYRLTIKLLNEALDRARAKLAEIESRQGDAA